MNRTTGSAEADRPGWLIVRADAAILAADERACALLRAPGPEGLAGRDWTSLVAHADRVRLPEVSAAVSEGRPWHGVLRLVYGIEPVETRVEVVPTEDPNIALVRLDGMPSPAGVDVMPGRATQEGDLLTRLAALEALEALDALPDASAAARAVLQAVHAAVPFDWAAVLRFAPQPGRAAEVLATYPGAMAGVAAGVTWSPLDPPEAAVLSGGEPALAGYLVRDPRDRSPLARMAAFGMRTRLDLPLFAHGRVAGALVMFAVQPHALGGVEGVRLERIARPLGVRIADSGPPPTPPADTAPEDPAPRQTGLGSPAPTPTDPSLGLAPTDPPSAPPPPDGRAVSHSTVEPAASRTGYETARLSALGELVSGVAHELNNPLTSILGYAQIFNTLDGEERNNAVQTIEQEAQRAARIVRNLLSFARQEPHQERAVDLEEVIGRVIEVRRYSLEVDNVRLATRFAGLPPVMADAAQFERAFLNLINNAQQALQPGGGEIVVTTSAGPDYVRVSIADSGPGVPEAMRVRIFEPFFTTHEVGGGQGMGLATVYGAVTDHGGRIWVEEAPSGGAQFVIELPLRAPTPYAAEKDPTEGAEQPAGAASIERAHILVVDDEAPIRALTTEILAAAGYHVATAASGEEALTRLEHEEFDLVLTDMRMPGMDGGALYDHVREHWPHLLPRLLFVTGDVDGERTSRRLSRSDVRYLEKPFDTRALLRAIRSRLDDTSGRAAAGNGALG
ncbi:MAG: ATP-binding protein [Dehalococcoidia bacterium]